MGVLTLFRSSIKKHKAELFPGWEMSEKDPVVPAGPWKGDVLRWHVSSHIHFLKNKTDHKENGCHAALGGKIQGNAVGLGAPANREQAILSGCYLSRLN